MGLPWIKVATDMFDDEKIKVIESMPEGDCLVTIWMKLLCLAGKKNEDGCIYVTKGIPYTTDTLACALNRPVTIVTMALHVFSEFQMLDIAPNGVIMLVNWEKHQNEKKLEIVREKIRLRVQKHREKQKMLSGSVTNVTVTPKKRNVTPEELEEELDKDININMSDSENKEPDIFPETEVKEIFETNSEQKEPEPPPKDLGENILIKTVIEYLNEKAKTNFRYDAYKTIHHLNARIREGYTLSDFKSVIDKKCQDWIGTKLENYLRPETLFNESKFESYVNQKARGSPSMSEHKESIEERVRRTKEKYEDVG